MRQHLAKLIWAASLSGCSLLYNPSNLPVNNDGGPDTPIADADPSKLQLDAVKSPPLLEGAGQGGSSPQLLVVFGMHITKMATVQVAPKNANTQVVVTVDLPSLTIANDGNSFAVLVRANYMETIDETGANMSGLIPLRVTVSQPGADPKEIEWNLKPLDELASGIQNPPAAGKLYSHVDITTGTLAFNSGTGRVIIKAVGDIKITTTVNADANMTTRAPGAGGCAGGEAGQPGMCHGGGKANGGGGGFAERGGNGGANTGGEISGDPLIKIYDGTAAEMNRPAGGAGGGAVASNPIGGGGGGSIELTAGGDISVGTVQASGADGASGGAGSGGGGGAGGLLLMRAHGTLTYPTAVTLGGGTGGGGTVGSGGNGSIGRWRVDASQIAVAPPPGADADTPAPRRGPMIVSPAKPIFDTKKPSVMITGKTGDMITVFTTRPDNSTVMAGTTMGADSIPFEAPELGIGINQICVVVPGGNLGNDEAKNCIEAAFVP